MSNTKNLILSEAQSWLSKLPGTYAIVPAGEVAYGATLADESLDAVIGARACLDRITGNYIIVCIEPGNKQPAPGILPVSEAELPTPQIEETRPAENKEEQGLLSRIIYAVKKNSMDKELNEQTKAKLVAANRELPEGYHIVEMADLDLLIKERRSFIDFLLKLKPLFSLVAPTPGEEVNPMELFATIGPAVSKMQGDEEFKRLAGEAMQVLAAYVPDLKDLPANEDKAV